MIISKDLIKIGIDENIIRILHSKTKLRDRKIESASLIRSADNKLLVKLDLPEVMNMTKGIKVSRRQVVINIDKNRIRELKLKIIFNK